MEHGRWWTGVCVGHEIDDFHPPWIQLMGHGTIEFYSWWVALMPHGTRSATTQVITLGIQIVDERAGATHVFCIVSSSRMDHIIIRQSSPHEYGDIAKRKANVYLFFIEAWLDDDDDVRLCFQDTNPEFWKYNWRLENLLESTTFYVKYDDKYFFFCFLPLDAWRSPLKHHKEKWAELTELHTFEETHGDGVSAYESLSICMASKYTRPIIETREKSELFLTKYI